MHLSSTVGKVFPVFRPGFLLTIFLDVAIAIIDEDTNLTRHEFIALLHPYKLPVVVCGLHTIAGNIDAEVCFFRYFRPGEAFLFKVTIIQKVTGTGRYSHIGYEDLYVLHPVFLFRYIVPGRNQIPPVFRHLSPSFTIQFCGLAAEVEDVILYPHRRCQGQQLVCTRGSFAGFPFAGGLLTNGNAIPGNKFIKLRTAHFILFAILRNALPNDIAGLLLCCIIVLVCSEERNNLTLGISHQGALLTVCVFSI